MRVLLFTGKGGVGKTTIAAATAVKAARAGARTLIMSTDPAHSLAASFDRDVVDQATPIARSLWAEQIDAQARLETNWREIQEYFIQLMNWAGVETIQAEELSVIPGLDEIFSLTDERTSTVRLVVNPEKMVIAEARRTYTYLGLFGYRVDAVIVNRIIPDDVTDPYFGKWKDIQAEHLQTVRESFAPVPILTARLFDREMVGVELLEAMAQEVYAETDVTEILYRDDPIRVRRRGNGYSLTMRLPFVSREDMDIHRRGDELFVRVGSHKRNLILPQTLKRLDVRGANFVGDHLEIAFSKEPEPSSSRDARNNRRGRANV